MNSKENSTGLAGEATLMCRISTASVDAVANSIDRKGGLLSKAQAAKHLSEMLLNELSDNLNPTKGAKGQVKGMLTFTFNERHLDTLHWLWGEVWELNQALAEQADDLQDSFTEFANASYDARQAVKS